MPNGHGGGVRFYSVIVLLLFAAGLFVYDSSRGAEWAIPVGYGLAVLIGERFAHHLHRWHVEDYGGAYVSDEEKAAARKNYITGAVIYMLGAVTAWHFLTI